MNAIKSLSFSREFDKQQRYFGFDSLTVSGDDQVTPGDNVDISFYFGRPGNICAKTKLQPK